MSDDPQLGVTKRRSRIGRFIIVAGLLLLVLTLVGWHLFVREPVLAFTTDGGRAMVLEAVTYGDKHVVGGEPEFLKRFGGWLPDSVKRRVFNVRQSTTLDARKSLVVWFGDREDGFEGRLDFRQVRVELVDEHGNRWGPDRSAIIGLDHYRVRQAYPFKNYPRWQRELTVHVTPEGSTNTTVIRVSNPHPVEPEPWSASSPPFAVARTNGVEVVLQELVVTGDTVIADGHQRPARGWKPQFLVNPDEPSNAGWLEPTWFAGDPYGNEGQLLGAHQPVLHFTARFLPESTNASWAKRVAKLPGIPTTADRFSDVWLQTNRIAGSEVVGIGVQLLHRKNHWSPPEPSTSETERELDRLIPGSIRLHAKAVGMSMLFLQCADPELGKVLGVRLRDTHGRVWQAAKHGSAGIPGFRIDLPDDVTHVVPEIVLLKPIEAEFTVKTPADSL